MNPISKPDYMPIPELRKMQLEKLQKLIPYEYEHVALFRRRCDEKGVKPRDLVTLADLAKFPFMKKTDLRDEYPYGLTAAPMSEINRFHCSSGTTGKPICIPQTAEDVAIWTEGVARCMAMYGITRDDIVQVSYGYGLFTGGPGLNGGSHKVGCLTLPMSSGNTDRQIQFMKDLHATILCCTPSYAAYIGETMKEMGLTPDQIPLKAGIFGAEAWSEEMRRDIEGKLGIRAYDIYGLTELGGPGVSYECEEQHGMHINEDHYIAEIINPKTFEQLPVGTQGELVFTDLTSAAFPVIRYRTRDICVLNDAPCSCGRTHLRMAKPMGRSDDMMIVKGVNVFPSQIETVLLNKGYPANYQIIVDRVNNTDTLDVQVEMTPEMFTDNMGEIAARQKDIVDGLKSMLGIKATVTLVAPKSIPRSEGKAKRVIDNRQI